MQIEVVKVTRFKRTLEDIVKCLKYDIDYEDAQSDNRDFDFNIEVEKYNKKSRLYKMFNAHPASTYYFYRFYGASTWQYNTLQMLKNIWNAFNDPKVKVVTISEKEYDLFTKMKKEYGIT